MRTSVVLKVCSVALVVGLFAVPGSAAPEDPEAVSRPGFTVSEGLRARFDAQRASARRPRRIAPVLEVEKTLSIVARLARFEDGVVLVSVPVSDRRKANLLRLGAAEPRARAPGAAPQVGAVRGRRSLHVCAACAHQRDVRPILDACDS